MTRERPPALFFADAVGLDFLNSIATPVDTPVDWIDDGAGLVAWIRAGGSRLREGAWPSYGAHALPGELDSVAAQARGLREWFRGFVDEHKGRPLATADLRAARSAQPAARRATKRSSRSSRAGPEAGQGSSSAPRGDGARRSRCSSRSERRWRPVSATRTFRTSRRAKARRAHCFLPTTREDMRAGGAAWPFAEIVRRSPPTASAARQGGEEARRRRPRFQDNGGYSRLGNSSNIVEEVTLSGSQTGTGDGGSPPSVDGAARRRKLRP